MSFMIANDDALIKYNNIWNKIKTTLNTKLHSMPVYDEKQKKAKVGQLMVYLKQTFQVVKCQEKMCITLVYPV